MINVIIKSDYDYAIKPILIRINASAKVHQLKDQIRNAPQSQMTDAFKLFITHNGCRKELHDNDRIMDYGIITNHTTLLLIPASDAHSVKFIQFKLSHFTKGEIHKSTISKLSHNEKLQTIDKIIVKYLRTTNINKLFSSAYCPFQSVFIRFDGLEKQVSLSNGAYTLQQYVKGFNGSVPSCSDDKSSFGLLPSNTLLEIMKQCDSENTDRYYHHQRYAVDVNCIVHVDITLPSLPFLLHDKYYYIDGEFYDKYDQKNYKTRLRFLPLLPKKYAHKSNIKTLVFGFVRNVCGLYFDIVPMDIINLMNRFYPELYGGMYEISEHNKGLSNKLRQKTETFQICGIEFYLRYVGEYENDDEYDAGLYLMCNCEKDKSITDVTFFCQLYCKSTKQSFSFIKNTNFCDSQKETVALNDFGNKSSLESVICNIQILNMFKSNELYEYQMELKQTSYLLEWIIDKTLINILNQCIDASWKQTFESEIFYNMFLLRCSVNEKGEFLFSIQVVALPANVLPLKTKCEIFVAETNHHVATFDASFDYTQNHSDVSYQLLQMDKQIKQKEQLTFRVQLEINTNEKD